MGCCKCCCLVAVIVGLIIAGSLGLLAGLFPYPSHASCQVDWTFGGYCPAVEETVVKQIKDWSHDDCTTKQRCGYSFLGRDGNAIRATHETPYLGYIDAFNFTFTPSSSGCSVKGISRSEAWYAVLDFGVNYCNLKNLIMGAELDEGDQYYTETSNNTICTMYSIAHCNFYT